MSATPSVRVAVLRDRYKRNSAVIAQSFGSKNTTTLGQGGSDGAIEVDQVGEGSRALIRHSPTGSTVLISQDYLVSRH